MQTTKAVRLMAGTPYKAAVMPWLVAAVLSVSVSAKPDRVPVELEYEPPPAARMGDHVTTVLTFRALANLDGLEVIVAPFKGVEVLSEPTKVTFTAMKQGETRPVTVTIRLTEEPFGYLSVTYRTQQGQTTDSGATTVVYGTAGLSQ